MQKNFVQSWGLPLDCYELFNDVKSELLVDILRAYIRSNELEYRYELFIDGRLKFTGNCDEVYEVFNTALVRRTALSYYKIVSCQNKNMVLMYDRKGKLLNVKRRIK